MLVFLTTKRRLNNTKQVNEFSLVFKTDKKPSFNNNFNIP